MMWPRQRETMAQESPDGGRGDDRMEELLSYIQGCRGFDFRNYKRMTLAHRIRRRMQAVGAESYRAYIDVLEANPDEFDALFDTILIKMTTFLRDTDAWTAFADAVIPHIARARAAHEQVRVWSAGCATGEEACSLAVLLVDALGRDRFVDTVKIYATDIDKHALAVARRGRYSEADVVGAFGLERARRCFSIRETMAILHPDLRRCLVFGRHDLIEDPPISNIDLLVCRNTLMYFTSDAQREVLRKLRYALRPSGRLFVGKPEAAVARMDIFEPVDAHHRIFRRRPSGRPAPAHPGACGPEVPSRPAASTDLAGMGEHSPIPQLIVSPRWLILAANHQARQQFCLRATELGTLMRADLFTVPTRELRDVGDRVLETRDDVTIGGVAPTRTSASRSFDVVFSPIGGGRGVLLTFLDRSRFRLVNHNLLHDQAALESACEELETANEELHSANEELEATNDDLQATAEALKLANKELQSANDDLGAVNEQLRVRGEQVSALSSFLESVLSSLKSAVVVVGTDMKVRAWNRQAEELWGVRATEVHDKHLLRIHIGFPVDALAPHLAACLDGREDGGQFTEQAVDRCGKPVECTVTMNRLVADDTVEGVILLMDVVTGSPPGTV